jgi:hypothetical protein
VCASLDEVIWALERIGVPLRRTKGATDARGQQRPGAQPVGSSKPGSQPSQ